MVEWQKNISRAKLAGVGWNEEWGGCQMERGADAGMRLEHSGAAFVGAQDQRGTRVPPR